MQRYHTKWLFWLAICIAAVYVGSLPALVEGALFPWIIFPLGFWIVLFDLEASLVSLNLAISSSSLLKILMISNVLIFCCLAWVSSKAWPLGICIAGAIVFVSYSTIWSFASSISP